MAQIRNFAFIQYLFILTGLVRDSPLSSESALLMLPSPGHEVSSRVSFKCVHESLDKPTRKHLRLVAVMAHSWTLETAKAAPKLIVVHLILNCCVLALRVACERRRSGSTVKRGAIYDLIFDKCFQLSFCPTSTTNPID